MNPPPYQNQVAGKTNIVAIFEGHILKPTCAIEYNHYRTISNVNPNLAKVLPFCCYVVQDGEVTPVHAAACNRCSQNEEKIVEILGEVAPTGYHVLLYDYAYSMVSPRIVDLKLGHRTWGNDKTEEKKKEMAVKDAASTSATMGIRLSGGVMTVNGVVQKLDKKSRGVFNDYQLKEYLKKFFNIRNEQVISAFSQTEKIRSAIKSSVGWHFIGASILFIIDEAKEEPCDQVVVKLIDLAHTTSTLPVDEENSTCDQGAVFGLNQLSKILGEMIDATKWLRSLVVF